MRLAALFFTLMLLWPGRGLAQDEPDPMVAYRAKTQVVKPCDRSGGGIIVCGNRAERNARQRLPLPREPAADRILPGDAPRASGTRVGDVTSVDTPYGRIAYYHLTGFLLQCAPALPTTTRKRV